MIIQGDCLDKLKELPDNSVDSIVTDPPYELGFMGKSWDNTGIANNPLMWGECLRVLKPGGHLLAFGGTRTYHRMASAIEDAGFEVRDMIEWVYGSGFPKSLNIGKAVDKLQGNEREELGRNPNSRENCDKTNTLYESGTVGKTDILTKGTSEWEGWGTALKPAHEPICMARKPLAEKSVAENCLKWGTGGINIDVSRVDVADSEKAHFAKEWDRDQSMSAELGGVAMNKGLKATSLRDNVPTGRFPANLIHDNSEEVRECFPETKSGAMNSIAKANQYNTYGKMYERQVTNQASEGNASRFFKGIIYNPKASKSERNRGCEGLEAKENAGSYEFRVDGSLDGKPTEAKSNFHPTVKPIALMEYLIKMVTPKGGVVLDPFAGSGSTLVAAKQNGFDFIGIEITEEYIPIIEARLEAVQPQMELYEKES